MEGARHVVVSLPHRPFRGVGLLILLELPLAQLLAQSVWPLDQIQEGRVYEPQMQQGCAGLGERPPVGIEHIRQDMPGLEVRFQGEEAQEPEGDDQVKQQLRRAVRRVLPVRKEGHFSNSGQQRRYDRAERQQVASAREGADVPPTQRSGAPNEIPAKENDRNDVDEHSGPTKNTRAVASRLLRVAEVRVRHRAQDRHNRRGSDEDDIQGSQHSEFKCVIHWVLVEVLVQVVVGTSSVVVRLRPKSRLPWPPMENFQTVRTDVLIEPLHEAVGEDRGGHAKNHDRKDANERHHGLPGSGVICPRVLPVQVNHLGPQRPHDRVVVLSVILVWVISVGQVQELREKHPCQHAKQECRGED
mmetsp:Transcript_79311/g.229393  ORF Transcript_79311/g.229393 Transcript_79311/m.229393 type:complete len:358 (-) Transcript_79311:1142-2215(-)